ASATWVDRVLGLRLMQRFGDVSYSWYLWHWPFVVLTTTAVQDDAVWIKVLASLAALGAAVAPYRWVENPVRFSPALRTWRRTAVVTLVLGLVVGGLTVTTRVAAASVLEREPYATAAATRHPPSYPCEERSRTESGLEACLFGDVDASTTVLLLGDSHAMQWIPAFDAAAKDAGLRLVVRWRHGCPAAEVPVVQPSERGSCTPFQQGSLRLVEDLRPDAVVVGQAPRSRRGPLRVGGALRPAAAVGGRAQINGGRLQRDAGARLHGQAALDLWESANDELFERLDELVPTVVAIEDNPKLGLDPLECLTRPWSGLGDCSVSRAYAETSNGDLPRISAEIWAAYGVTTWDGVWSE